MKNFFITGLLFLCFQLSTGQEVPYLEQDIEINNFTSGTLSLPASSEAESLVIFIQGSGPTDRDGNQSMMKNDGMKKLARQLAENGIASFRFDKRIFKMHELKIQEKDLRFENFVNDVKDILNYFEEKDQFENLILAGHSEGSLIGILAAGENTEALISLAGAGQPIDDIIVEQIEKMAPPLAENARKAFDEIRKNGKTNNYSPMLESMFRASVQPYMYSWMQYNPAREIAKLDIPVLIVNGTADVQVETKEAEMLKNAYKDAELVIIENMNHIFREIKSDDKLVNTKSYNEPNRPLHPRLVPVITKFIKELE